MTTSDEPEHKVDVRKFRPRSIKDKIQDANKRSVYLVVLENIQGAEVVEKWIVQDWAILHAPMGLEAYHCLAAIDKSSFTICPQGTPTISPNIVGFFESCVEENQRECSALRVLRLMNFTLISQRQERFAVYRSFHHQGLRHAKVKECAADGLRHLGRVD
jgi:hypothetical protein